MSDNTLTVIEIPNGDDFDGVWSQAEADEVSDAVDVLHKWGGREIVLTGPKPASRCIFPLVDEELIVYATDTRIKRTDARGWSGDD